MTWLLDGNVLVALAIETHEHHRRALRWFDRENAPFATCLLTQGTLLRVHMTVSPDPSPAAAWAALRAVVDHPDHVYWNDAFSYLELPHRPLQGPKQVTDAWLAELARRRKGKVATLDVAFAALDRDVVRLIPVR